MYARFFHFWAPKPLKWQKTGFWQFLAISEGIRLLIFFQKMSFSKNFILVFQMVDIGPYCPRFERFRKRHREVT